MNPNNYPRIVKANIFDKHMADAFSLTEPMQAGSSFDLMNSKMNPESISTVFAYNGYSNACGTGKRNLCLKKCAVIHPNHKRDAYKNCVDNCPSADEGCVEERTPAGGILGTGIGSGRRRACKDAGLSGAEKRDCAKELRSRGWKKGDPIPADMAGITSEDAAQTETAPPSQTLSTPAAEKDAATGAIAIPDWAKWTIIGTVGVVGISFLVWGISSSAKTSK